MISIEAQSVAGGVRYPCSFAQERFLLAERDRPGDPAFNVTMRWRICGDLNQNVLEQAWRILLARHEALRTGFALTNGRFEQIVNPSAALRISIIDCSALDRKVADVEIDRVASADARAPFDVATAPLIRVTRVVIEPHNSILVVTAHQLICDGWSFGILAREMGQICDALAAGTRPELPELTTNFGEYARWQRTALTDDALAEEFDLLRGDISGSGAFELPTDNPRPERWSSNVDTRTRVLDRSSVERLLHDARELGATPFMAFLATLTLLLRERSGASSITLTTQVAGRDDVDLEGLVGLFVNTMPLRLEVSAGRSFDEVLGAANNVIANAFELRHVPFERVAGFLFGPQLPDRGGPCAVNFVYQKAFTQNAEYRTFRLESQHSRPGGSSCDLGFYIVERPGEWRLSCDYNPDLFEAQTVDALLARFEELIARGVDRRDPVLFFHSDLFADGFYAEEIAAAIPDHRIVPVAPHGIGEFPILDTIDAMADDYVARIGTIQPAGPYRLAGFCAGAQVAIEVARRLRERGAVVEQVVLINATAPVRPLLPFRDRILHAIGCNPKLGAGIRTALVYNIARLNRALLRGPRTTARFGLRLLLSLMQKNRFGMGLHEGETYLRQRGSPRTELSFAHIIAVLAHHPHYYDGDVTLIWSVDQPSLTEEPTQGWHRLARSVSVVPMSGGHVAVLHSLVGQLSQILSDVLGNQKETAGS
jgi:thioesterase domain-containing protein